MALTPEQIEAIRVSAIRENGDGDMWYDIEAVVRAVEAEVRKDDDALIQQLVEALTAMQAEAQARACGLRICDEAITAGRARLEGNP